MVVIAKQRTLGLHIPTRISKRGPRPLMASHIVNGPDDENGSFLYVCVQVCVLKRGFRTFFFANHNREEGGKSSFCHDHPPYTSILTYDYIFTKMCANPRGSRGVAHLRSRNEGRTHRIPPFLKYGSRAGQTISSVHPLSGKRVWVDSRGLLTSNAHRHTLAI